MKSLFLILTNRCNLGCSYCYQEVLQPACMSRATLQAALDQLLAGGERQPEVVFSGGEPLLEFEQIRWATEYLLRQAASGQRFRFKLFTNGLLISEEAADFLAGHGFEIQLSYDGVPAAQDWRGEGTSDLLEAMLARLNALHPEYFRHSLTVTMTVLPDTVAYLTESVEYFLAQGVRRLTMAPVLTDTSAWPAEMISELEEQFSWIVERSLEHLRHTGDIPLLLFRPESAVVEEPTGFLDPTYMCSALDRDDLAVDIDGSVYGCGMLVDSVGSARSPLLTGLVAGARCGEIGAGMVPLAPVVPAILQKDAKYSTYGRCAECVHRPRCTVCPVAIGSQTGCDDPHRVPDFICAFNSTVLKSKDEFLAQANLWRTRLNPDMILEQMRPWLAWLEVAEEEVENERK